VTQTLAKRIVSAPNRSGVPATLSPKVLAISDAAYVAAWRSVVGPPAAELAVGVIDPADFRLVHDIVETDEAEGDRSTHTTKVTINWEYPDKAKKNAAFAGPPKGTLVFLHGIMMTRESMVPWALYFAQRNYRVVLVDLRGHGRSTGKWIGFGAWEAEDLVKVADELERRGLLVGKLGVFGVSYGAAMGIHWAARDSRVTTVVALAPFSDPVAAIPDFARGFDPHGAGTLSNETFTAAAAKAEKIAGFEWKTLSVLDSIRKMHAPVLFFHGEKDHWVLPANTDALERAAPAGSRRVLTDDDHTALQVRLDLVGPQALAWFDERLASTSAEGVGSTVVAQ
jgi:pimeloyl-ACP methyl ester carboxylesterase